MSISIKALALHYALNSALMRLKLAPITSQSGVVFVSSRSFTHDGRRDPKVHTVIAIKEQCLELHEYSSDMREHHLCQEFQSMRDFLKFFIGRRIEVAARIRTSCDPEVRALSEEKAKDYDSFARWANACHDVEQAIVNQYNAKLNSHLDSLAIRIARAVVGY